MTFERVRIDALAAGGRGIGRVRGRVWFVAGAVPGDLAVVEPVRDRGRHVEGRLLRLEAPSADRRVSPCRLQDACGGCPLMALDEAKQREWRRRFVVDALERIGGLVAPPVEAVADGPSPLAYRNRLELFLVPADSGGPPVLGLHARDDPRAIVDVDRCLLQDDSANGLLRSIRELAGCVIPPVSGFRPGRSGARIVIRRSEAGGELLLGIREAGPGGDGLGDLARTLRERHPELVGVVRLRSRGPGRGGTRTEAVAGQGWIEERIDGLTYRVPAATFLQVSARAATVLVECVADLARPEAEEAIDLYCGVGLHAHGLARRGLVRSVIAVDADRDAVDCGRDVASREALPVRFERADVSRFLAERRGAPDLVVANPPRTGMGPGVAARLRDLGPARIVIVSCEAATLARDVATLLRDASPYRLERVIPFDLFPQTAHVETVSLVVRR